MKQLILLIISLSLFAQFRDPGSWKVTRVGAAANRPATCQANRDAFVCSGSGCSPNPSLEFCTATNTFTAFSGGGSGTVTSVDAGNGVETVSGSAITSTGTIRGAIAINAQTGTSYTIVTGDRGKLITHSNGSATAYTLPQAGVSFPAGWFAYVQNLGAGTVTITPTTSTIDGAASLALTTNQGTIIVSNGTDYFTMRGIGVAGSGTVTSVATTSPITGGTITGSGTIACATCVTSAASLTSNLPVIGGGGQATAVGTRSGNTTKVVTMDASSPAANDCAKWDASGNLTTAGAACGSGGSSGLTLIEQHTASSSASLDFTTCISSTYDQYLISVVDVLPATDGALFAFRVSTDGGSTYVSTSSYYWAGFAITAGSSGNNGSTSEVYVTLITNQESTAGGFAINGTYYLSNPLGTTNFKTLYGHGMSTRDSGSVDAYVTHGGYKSTTAVNAFRFLFSSGNIASGTIRCYGVAK